MRILAFLSFLSCVSLVYPINCTENQFKSLKTPGLCCKLCSAGEFMSKECERVGIETTCLPCPKNEFTRTPNNLSSCKKCRDVSACDGGRYPVQDCTPTLDVQCECPVNKYWNTHTFWCEECTVCERGERLISPCGTYKDAVCEKCQQGTFVNISSNNCVPCSYCSKGETVIQECIWQDTICKKVNAEMITPPQQTCPPTLTTDPDQQELQRQVVQSTPESRSQKDYRSQSPVPCEKRTFGDGVIWLLLGFVILLVFVVLILSIQLIKRKPMYCLNNKIQTPKGTAGRDVPKGSVAFNGKPVQTIQENNIMFNTISANVIEDLARYLNCNQGKNWKNLAGLMGYDSVFTANLELTPTEACQRLLQEWQQRSDATVYVLYCWLQQLCRDDAVAVLWPLLVEQSSESEIV